MFDTKDLEKFREYLRTCAGGRVERLADILVAEEKYHRFAEAAAGFYRQVDDSLPENLKRALANYVESKNEIAGMEQAYFYEHGFRDAVMLMRTLFFDGL